MTRHVPLRGVILTSVSTRNFPSHGLSPLRSFLILYLYFSYLVKSLAEKGKEKEKGVIFVRPTTTTLRTPPTHQTFVQWMTLPKVVLKYYKQQWHTEGNENSRQTILPLTRADRMVVPTIFILFNSFFHRFTYYFISSFP